MTSHDVVAAVRRWLPRGVRVGHTGTLDPDAAGVLTLLLGKATRLAAYLENEEKVYRAEITFGWSTDSQDSSGEPVEVRPECSVALPEVLRAMQRFVGTIQQVPPMVSARRYEGQHLYELARQGRIVQRQARAVQIYAWRLLEPQNAPPYLGFGQRLLTEVRCSRGTYVRTLCHDLGSMLGCPAHLSLLLRVRSGAVSVGDCFALAEVQAAWRSAAPLLQDGPQSGMWPLIRPPQELFPDLPRRRCTSQETARIVHGQPLPILRQDACGHGDEKAKYWVLLGPDGRMVALAQRRDTGLIWPVCVLA